MFCIIEWNIMNLSEYIRPLRLQKIIMSLSGIVLGTLLAAADYHAGYAHYCCIDKKAHVRMLS